MLGVVTESTRQMGELIDDLLRFARISRQEIEPAVIDMTRLARLVVAECRELEPDRDVTVTINPLPVARGDQPMIRQALANLVSNAFKFTRPRPDARIEIGGEEGPTETTYLVRDNGVGFDPRYADQLFKVFQRLHSSKEFEGTGIGLAIVARVAHRHGGRVWADGIEGTGATFAFALPRKGGTNEVEILLVEDNPADAELTLRALTKHSLANKVLVVGDGAEALDYLFATGAYAGRAMSETPRVVFLDLKLPKVSGLDVLRRIKSDERTKRIPVVVLTSSNEERDIVMSYELGGNSYVVKPVDFERFSEAIQELGLYWLVVNRSLS